MKTISVALAAHLAQECTTLATCWKITRTDATVFGFTDHDQDLEVAGVTYAAATGYSRTAIKSTAGLQVDNLDIEGMFDAEAITEDALRAVLWDYAAIEIFLVNWNDLTQGTLPLRKGTIGEVKVARNGYVVELRGMMQRYQQTVGRVYAPACDADLYDTRCGVNPASFTVTGTVTGVTSRRVFADTSRAEANDYFNGGKLTFTSGENNGLSVEVKDYTLTGGAVELQLPMPYTIAVGDTYTLLAGCDKSAATCNTKFSNVINFRGFNLVPGAHQMISGGLN